MKKRNIGLDIARIIAMLGIIVLHLLGAGGVLKKTQPNQIQYWVAWLLEIWAYCSVDLFALLSGYLCQSKKIYSSNRIISLILTVAFYCVFITALFAVIAPERISGIKELAYSLFPPFAGRYWYITCYIAAYFIFPYINKLLDSLSSEQIRKLLFTLAFLLSILPSLLSKDIFRLDGGYSTAWLLACYTFGAIISREKVEILLGKEVIAFLGISAFNLMIMLAGQLLLDKEVAYMLGYTSPFTLLSAVLILQRARQIKVKNARIQSCVISLSGAAFDVYILHCHYLVFDYLILDKFVWVANYGAPLMIVVVLALCVFVYFCGSVVAAIRKRVFKLLCCDTVISKIALRVDKYII